MIVKLIRLYFSSFFLTQYTITSSHPTCNVTNASNLLMNSGVLKGETMAGETETR